jgi:hypothetical protein
MVKNRKRRQDTTHLVYVITNIFTGEQYIGITVKNPGGVFKTLRRRMQKHLQRALSENKAWSLSENLRDWGADAFTFGLVNTIRGRRAAHQLERSLIKEYTPAMNTF